MGGKAAEVVAMMAEAAKGARTVAWVAEVARTEALGITGAEAVAVMQVE